MKYYAEGIQKFQRELRLPVSSFSDILEEETKNDLDSQTKPNEGGSAAGWAIIGVVAVIDYEKEEGEGIHFIKNQPMGTVREQHTVQFIINTEGELQSGEHSAELE